MPVLHTFSSILSNNERIFSTFLIIKTVFLLKRLAFKSILIYYLFVVIPPDNLIISNPKYPF